MWSKPLGIGHHAVFILSNASSPINVTVSLGVIDLLLNGSRAVVVRDLYRHAELGRVRNGTWTAEALAPHDSRFLVFALQADDPPCDLLEACISPS